ncbi:hypothetical protein D3C73_1523500 [compost metagenome]
MTRKNSSTSVADNVSGSRRSSRIPAGRIKANSDASRVFIAMYPFWNRSVNSRQ